MTHDVLRLEVTMHDAAGMSCGYAVEHRLEPLRNQRRHHRAVPFQRDAQRVSLHTLHHDVRTFAFQRSDVMHGDDVRMAETRRCARFTPEAAQRTRLTERTTQHDLRRDHTIELQIVGFVHRTHAAAADEPVQPVARIDRARHRQ